VFLPIAAKRKRIVAKISKRAIAVKSARAESRILLLLNNSPLLFFFDLLFFYYLQFKLILKSR